MNESRIRLLWGIFASLLFLCGSGAQAEQPPIINYPAIDVDLLAEPITFLEAVANDPEFNIWLARFDKSRARNGAPKLLMGHGSAPRYLESGYLDLDRIVNYRTWRPKGETFKYSVEYPTLAMLNDTFRQRLAQKEMGIAFWCNSQHQAVAITANTGHPMIGVARVIAPGNIFPDVPTPWTAPKLHLNIRDGKNGVVTLDIPENQNRNVVLGDKVYIPISEVDRVFGPPPADDRLSWNWKDKAKGGARGLRDWFLPGAAEAAAANQVARQIGYRTSAQIAGRTVVSVAPYAGVTAAIAGPPAVIVASDPSGQAPNNARRLAEAVPHIGSQATRNGFSIAGERLRSGAAMLWSPIDSGLLERTWNGLTVGIPDRVEILYRSWTE